MGPPSRPTSSSHWASQLSPCAQSFQRGYSLPPILNTGGASYANSDQVGASDLSLLLGGVVHYALLNDTSYSLPLPIQLRWDHSLFGGRECPSIPDVWTYSSTTEARAMQAPSSSRLPASWPSCSQSSGASSSRATSSASRSQPIYSEWMGLNGGGEDFGLILRASVFSTSSFFGGQFPWLKFTSFCLPFLVPFG